MLFDGERFKDAKSKMYYITWGLKKKDVWFLLPYHT